MSKRELLAQYRQRLAERQAGSQSSFSESQPQKSDTSQSKQSDPPKAGKKGRLKQIAQKKTAKQGGAGGEFNTQAHPRAAAGSANGGQFVKKGSGNGGSTTPAPIKPPALPAGWNSEKTADGSGNRRFRVSGDKGSFLLTMDSPLYSGGKGSDPDNPNFPGRWDLNPKILGLTPDSNQVVMARLYDDYKGNGKPTSKDQTELFLHHALSNAKEGSLVLASAEDLMETSSDAPEALGKITFTWRDQRENNLVRQGMEPRVAYEQAYKESEGHREQLAKEAPQWIADHPLSQHMTTLDPGWGRRSTLAGVVRNGRLTPLTPEDLKKGELGEKVRAGRKEQIDAAVAYQSATRPASKEVYAQDEDRYAANTDKLEDEWMGRKPQPGVVKSVDHYQERANDWAKSQGFDDGGVNGFTAEATKAHDLSHPVTHDLIGMDSSAIHQHFGSITQKGGTPSLLGEEAIVNVVEHLSRGDSLEASVISGMRVARVLSRNEDYETDKGRAYVRGDEFKDKLMDLANQVYRNDNYSEYMGIVRQSNRVSGTVARAGNDFTQTASGG